MTNAPNPALTSTAYEGWLPTLELATREVFELMLGCTLAVPSITPSQEGLEIASMVGLAGRLRGVLTLRCSGKSAARIAACMLGVDADNAGPEMWDALGEVCNMVAGNFKNKISGLGDGCTLSVPTVVTGGKYSLHYPMVDAIVRDVIRTTLLFEGEPIAFCLEIHN